jgi:hypothetical protein
MPAWRGLSRGDCGSIEGTGERRIKITVVVSVTVCPACPGSGLISRPMAGRNDEKTGLAGAG